MFVRLYKNKSKIRLYKNKNKNKKKYVYYIYNLRTYLIIKCFLKYLRMEKCQFYWK